MVTLSQVFSAQGLLQQGLEDYIYRPEQVAMAEAIMDAIEKQRPLLVEAGTGTGKTFAYLIPAILANQKVLISTGTKTLQDQLFQKDIPFIIQQLKLALNIRLLKGRGNYLCLHRLEQASEFGLFDELRHIEQIKKIYRFSKITRTGDISECSEVPQESEVWSHATSTKENCLGQECLHYEDCFVLKARQRAQQADIVVVNHHLLCADIALKEEGFGDILPAVSVVIIDEAHQLPEVAMQFFGSSLSSWQMVDLCFEAEKVVKAALPDQDTLLEHLNELADMAKRIRQCFPEEKLRQPWLQLSRYPGFLELASLIKEKLIAISQALGMQVERSKEVEQCWERFLEYQQLWGRVTGQEKLDAVHWGETYARSLMLHLTPLDISPQFKRVYEETKQTWIFTSATLIVDGHFEHIQQRLGVVDPSNLCLASPFDFQTQALFFLPRQIPDPKADNYMSCLLGQIKPILDALNGRTFLLCTSYQALQKAAELLESIYPGQVLVQGTLPKTKLLEQFKSHGNAILVATYSFWEGVDVKGQSLACVVIDKLPFTVPSDPVTQARIQHIKKQGKDPFYELQLPEAIISLKQGIGRLIRAQEDRGIIVLADPRLLCRDYGQTILKSLPLMPRTRSIDKVISFIEESKL